MTWSDRKRELRDARLRHIEQQVSSGALVIRQMSASEHAVRAREREEHRASMTPSERARGERLLRERRRRGAFFSSAAADTGDGG